MSWHLRPLAAFDLETTGTDPERDRIVTAAVSVVGASIAGDHRSWFLDPGIEIPAGATAVHGISTERAQSEGMDARTAVQEITAILAARLREGTPVVAFNARFDLTILDREARRHGLVPLVERVGGPSGLIVIDPFVLDKHLDRFRPGKRTLGAVCAHYRIKLEEAHAANSDALAAARVAYRLASVVPELREADLHSLHAEQIQWAAEQAASLQDYFVEMGRPEHVEGAWPIVPMRPRPQEVVALAA
jgi:DNA polymerase-3 subunit epsilon